MSLKQTTVPEFNPSSTRARIFIRNIRKSRPRASYRRALRPGSMLLLYPYVAVTGDVYDLQPVVIILKVYDDHVLALNINWLRKADKRRLQQIIVRSAIIKKRMLDIPINRSAIGIISAILNFTASKLRREETDFAQKRKYQRFFERLTRYSYVKKIFRLYRIEEIKKSKVYNLTSYEFLEALSLNIIKRAKVSKRPKPRKK